MEDDKLQNLIVELLFFLFRVAINKALPVTTQSFASSIYKIKHIEVERYDLLPKDHSGIWGKNIGAKCSGAVQISLLLKKLLLKSVQSTLSHLQTSPE